MTPLALLFILAFLVSVDVRILGPVLPSIAASLGAAAGSAGLAMTSYALAYDSGQLVYGRLFDHFGRIAVVASVRFGRA
ncbi:MAG TPA: MFS transporter [Methylomirabilota bacterium]